MIFHGSFYSKYLEQDTRVTVTGPEPDPSKPYRVLYLLHPLCCNADTWCDYTRLPFYIRSYNVLCVMPEVNRSFYTDQKFGQKYFSYVGKELPEFINRLFRVSAKREDTSVAGVSMGGYGALRLALSFPEKFGFCAVSSSAFLFLKADLDDFRSMTDAEIAAAWGPQMKHDLEAMFGPELKAEPGDEIMTLLENTPCGCKPEIFHCCGTEDIFYAQNKAFSEVMKEWGAYKYTFREWKGTHHWNFFDEFLKQALEFHYSGDKIQTFSCFE